MYNKLLLLTLIFMSLITFGQHADSIRQLSIQQKADVIVTRLETDLSLSNKQKKQVQKIVLDRLNKLEYGFNDMQLEAANLEAQEKLRLALTDEQYVLYDKIRKNIKKQKQEWLIKNRGYFLTTEDQQLDF